jgi:hypothetical protein
MKYSFIISTIIISGTLTINHSYQPLSTIINHYQPLSTIINHSYRKLNQTYSPSFHSDNIVDSGGIRRLLRTAGALRASQRRLLGRGEGGRVRIFADG